MARASGCESEGRGEPRPCLDSELVLLRHELAGLSDTAGSELAEADAICECLVRAVSVASELDRVRSMYLQESRDRWLSRIRVVY